jgi:type III pantothenate kinase
MLLVIDVGNTNTVLGVFDGDRLATDWRIRTERNSTEDELNILVRNLFALEGLSPLDIHQTVISCVVPPMVSLLSLFCIKYLDHEPLWVDPRQTPLMPNLYDNPSEVGADRIVNGVAAYDKYRSALVVIDFGTATTFDAISAKGDYLGGAISPGIGISAEALFLKASKLPRVEIFKQPEVVIGKDTATSIKSGIIFGYAGLVDGMVFRMKKELGGVVKTVATGGLAPLMKGVSETIDVVEPNLTLVGLKLIGESMTPSALP